MVMKGFGRVATVMVSLSGAALHAPASCICYCIVLKEIYVNRNISIQYMKNEALADALWQARRDISRMPPIAALAGHMECEGASRVSARRRAGWFLRIRWLVQARKVTMSRIFADSHRMLPISYYETQCIQGDRRVQTTIIKPAACKYQPYDCRLSLVAFRVHDGRQPVIGHRPTASEAGHQGGGCHGECDLDFGDPQQDEQHLEP